MRRPILKPWPPMEWPWADVLVGIVFVIVGAAALAIMMTA